MNKNQLTSQDLVRVNWTRSDQAIAVYDYMTPDGTTYLPMRGSGFGKYFAFIREGSVVAFQTEKEAFDWLRNQGWEHIPDVE